MRLPSHSIICLLAALAGWSGCGQSTPEIMLNVAQDGTKPCLGAAHLEISVITVDGVQVFHEFGQFFDVNTHACLIPTYSFPELPLGRGIQIAVSMWDSTSDNAGHLATGSSVPIDVKASSPTTQLDLNLTRRVGVELGSIIILKPDDWQAISGVTRLQFRITPEDEQTPIRSGFFSFAPELRDDPFPLIVSALPQPAVMTGFEVAVEAYRDQEPLRTWTGWAYLGPDNNPGYLQP